MYVLSEPSDKDYYQDCIYDHTTGDVTIEQCCNQIFNMPEKDAVKQLESKVFAIFAKDGSGPRRQCRVDKIGRGGAVGV